MGNRTNIEWCDSTVNPTTGCQGCELWAGQVRTCYAGQLQTQRLSRAHPQQYAADFTEVRLAPGRMAQAAAWSDLAGTRRPNKPWLDGMPRTIFVGDMGDVFSAAVPFAYLRDEVFAAIESPAGRRHIWMLLTKQPQRMREVAQMLGHWPDNAWAGVSVTSQANASRIQHLVELPAPIRFVSAEPLLGPVDLSRWTAPVRCEVCGLAPATTWILVEDNAKERFCNRCHEHYPEAPSTITALDRLLDWVIVGGESGPKARPCHLDWVRSIVEQCQSAQVPPFVKQLGALVQDGLYTMRGQSHPTEPHYMRLRDAKGGNPHEWPEGLCERDFPRVGAAAKVVPHG